MTYNSWVDLEDSCPINIERIIKYANSFNSKVIVSFDDLEDAKSKLLDARGDFDLMITSLIQLLHDSEILKEITDVKLFNDLKSDLGRYLKKLDEKENYYLVEEDTKDSSKNRVYTSRIGAYSKLLVTSANSIIYESLLKATNEYNSLKGDKEVEKNKRTFLYILFQVLQITLSVLGAYTRESTPTTQKVYNDYVGSNYKNMLSEKGQKMIKDSIKDEVGTDENIKNLEDLYGDFGDIE